MTIHLKITLVVFMALVDLSFGTETFWESDSRCRDVRDSMRNNQNTDPETAKLCIIVCFVETTRDIVTISPAQCLNQLMKPYIRRVLRKQIPSQDEINRCLRVSDRSNCHDTLLYYFSKWYKDNYDDAHYKRYAKFLFQSWVHNPDIPHPYSITRWEWDISSEMAYLRFDSEQDIEAVKKVTSLADRSLFPVIHRELQRYCYKPNTEHTKEFCKLRIVMNIANKMRILATKKTEYLNNFDKYKDAINFNFIVLSSLYDSSIANRVPPSTPEEKAKLFDGKLNELAELSKSRDTEAMLNFLELMPETDILTQACRQQTYPAISRRSCILAEVQEQLLIYSKMAEKRKSPNSRKKAVVINFSINMRGIIQELRGEEIFKMLLEQRYDSVSYHDEMTNLIEGKFVQLQGYFTKLQSFNMQKASADVAYVKGMIDYYQGKVTTSLDNVSEQVGTILQAAIVTQGLEVAEKIVKLAFAIAEACNPLKTVFNGGTATDIMDALSELMSAISRLVEAVANMRRWPEVLDLVKEISEGFNRNSEFLSAVGRVVNKIKLEDFPNDEEFEESKATFLRLYNAYSPAVDAEKLTLLGTKLNSVVELSCNLIDSTETSLGSGYVASVKDNMYCPKAEESINSMIAIFQEIYDFQFELIESMAQYLKSSTGYHAAQKMVVLAGQPINAASNDDLRNDLRANIIMAHTTYEIQKQAAIQGLCDFLEYKEGGTTPDVCNTSPINVPALLSYIPRRCTSVNKFVSIPISTEPRQEIGHIDLKALYSGKEVTFDISSYDWLKDHKWLDDDEDLKAVFVRSFQIFLPTVTRGRSAIRVTTKGIASNKFTAEGTRYSIMPLEGYRLDYTSGKRYLPCSGTKMDNPYSICEDRKLPKLCVMSDLPTYVDDHKLYPTIFSRFKIKAKGIAAAQTPEPETPLDIKAKINMCIYENGPARLRRQAEEVKAGCCDGNAYWSEDDSTCKQCVAGSTSNLNGYYCEKNQDALSVKKKKNQSSSKDNKSRN